MALMLHGGTAAAMNIHGSVHVIAVPNLAKSCAFYRDVLGFEIKEMGDPGWRMYVSGPCHIKAGECHDAMAVRETGDHSYFMYLTVDDVAAFHDRAAAGGADITKPIRDEPWEMREFGLQTVDGHRIMIGQRIG
jgi:predicted enzyme related to lactoylglutathione lyase